MSLSRFIGSRLHRYLGVAVATFVAFGAGALRAVEAPSRATQSEVVLTTFEQIWRAADNEPSIRHPVRFDFVVYYYDPLWRALWGRSGDADSYLSLGPTVFPIKAGQRIRVEGTMLPSAGMTVDEPKITILDDSAPLDVLPTAGKIDDTERFNKRMVTVDGYVDGQTARDANHLELRLIVEGHVVTAELPIKSSAAAPAFKNQMVRLRGVYFARNEPGNARLEVWVPGPDAIASLGAIDGEARFSLPVTPIAEVAKLATGAAVHVGGACRELEPGRRLTIHDDSGDLAVPVAQTRPVAFGERVDVVGVVSRNGGEVSIAQALYRAAPKVLRSIDELYELPESEMQDPHPFHTEVLVYYFDPYWRVVWGRDSSSDTYLSFSSPTMPFKGGQRILVEGTVVPAKGSVIESARVQILDESVPLHPLSTQGQVGAVERFNRRFVTVEGYVDRQVQTDLQHVELDLVAEDRLVTVRLLSANAPPLEGTLARVRGVYSATTDPAGGRPKIELWAESNDAVVLEGNVDHDPRFNIPATPIDRVASAPKETPLRVLGSVWSQQPGRSVTLRDATGLLTVRSVQLSRLAVGVPVEAIGYPSREGADVFLAHGFYRHATTAITNTRDAESLRLAGQVRDLAPEEAARGRPVHLTGVVTWAAPKADFFFIRDISGGVYVAYPHVGDEVVPVGRRADVWGVSAVGDFVPIVTAARLLVTGDVDLPEARPVTLEQALTGVEEAQWVSMTGYVRAVGREGRWNRLELTTSAGEFTALLPPDSEADRLVGTVVSLRGVCNAVTNRKRQLTGIRLWVPSGQYIQIEEPVPADLFSVPLRSVASLRQFNSLQMSNRRVRVAGTVISQSPGRFLHVQDGADGVLVLSRETIPLQPGDRIEAVGFPGRESSRVVLREAVYRRLASGAEPLPVPVRTVMPADPELDGRLVRLQAQLLDLSEEESGARLVLQGGNAIFEALLNSPKGSVPGDWLVGSRLEVTGVYLLDFDEYRRPGHVRLQLRTPADVRVLERASWWTIPRVLYVTGVLAIGSIMVLGWVVALRRRVRQQTRQIRAQVENEKAARLEAALARASKLESLGILAGGIAHDFNNLLTVIMCNLSLARLDRGLGPDTHRCIDEGERATSRARDLTQQLLTFAKGGAPVRDSVRLPDVVRESAEFALHGAKARFELEVEPSLWPAHVDKGQIGRVVQNIVINANQAMPDGGTILIRLGNAELSAGAAPPLGAGRYLKLTICDTGSGIPPEQLARIFDPYFTTKQHGSGLGLATVYSIVKQHQGHVEVASNVGHGTTFTVWLPAADRAPDAARVAPSALPRCTGRVLFMDDESSIRQLAGAVLKRMGLEATLVADGAEVVQEYQNAYHAGHAYDLVILDLTVPGGMGGMEAMQRLLDFDPTVRAIVSSGYSSDPIMGNHHAHGFAAIVAKPYEAVDLARTVGAVLGRGVPVAQVG